MSKNKLKDIIKEELDKAIKEFFPGAAGSKTSAMQVAGKGDFKNPYGSRADGFYGGYYGYGSVGGMPLLASADHTKDEESPQAVDLKKKLSLTPQKARGIGNILNVNWKKVNFKEFYKGMWVELEHGAVHPRLDVTHSNLINTAKIALAHLVEDPQYYTKLKKYVEKDQPTPATIDESMMTEKKFINMEEFKKFHPAQRQAFLETNTEMLGQGSSRNVYLVDSSRALKVSRNTKGIAQNKAELEVYTDPKTNKLINKIYDYDPNNTWLLVELVRPIETYEEFNELTGIDDYVRSINFHLNLYPQQKFAQFFSNPINQNTKDRVAPFTKMAIMAKKNADLYTPDVTIPSHWGKTADGRVVIYDYGATNEVIDKHYFGNTPTEATKQDINQVDGENILALEDNKNALRTRMEELADLLNAEDRRRQLANEPAISDKQKQLYQEYEKVRKEFVFAKHKLADAKRD